MTPNMVRANEVDFAYFEAGQGPLVLCLHGFVPVLNRLAAGGYHAVAPFMRGYPPSGLGPGGDYRIITLGRDALALIEALGAQRASGRARLGCRRCLYRGRARPRADTVAPPHLHRFLFWPSLRQLKRSRYMGFFQLRGIPERRIVADDFKWLRALIREWSPGWNFSEEDFRPLKAAFSDPVRLAAALTYYRAIPRALTERESWALLYTQIKLPARMIRSADDGCIGPEMFEGQEKFFGAGFELMTLQGAGHFMHCEQPDAFAHLVLEFIQ